MEGRYNMRSPAVKRLMKEAQELREPTEQYFAQPLEDNLFEWHFTIRGPADSEFEGGIYHGRIILPPDYPMKPPSIMLLTPNGRFEIFKKICLSISGHHPESWQPSWSIRTALLAIIGFMPTHGSGAIGSLDYTPEERKVLAKKSQDWKCPSCGNVNNILKTVTEASEKTKQEAKELASQINFQGEKEKKEMSSPAASNESGASAGASSETTPVPSPESASSTSTPPPVTPSMFPWVMPGMRPPFPATSGANQQFRFPFPPSPFMIPPEWQQPMPGNMPPRYPPFLLYPGFPGVQSPMTGTSQMPSMVSRYPTHTIGETNTTSSSSRPVMSSERSRGNNSESDSRSKKDTEPASSSSTCSPAATSSTSASASSTSTTSATTTSNSQEGLRQRQTSRAAPAEQAQTPSPAPVFDQRQEQPSPQGLVSSGLMLVIGLIILALLIRRLYMMDFLH